MGFFDKIKTGAGLNYLEPESQNKSSSKKQEKKVSKANIKQDRELQALESKLNKAIKILQEVQEKLRVRRGI